MLREILFPSCRVTAWTEPWRPNRDSWGWMHVSLHPYWFHWFLLFIWKLFLFLSLLHFRSSHSSTMRSTPTTTMPVVCPSRGTTWTETPLSWSVICSWRTLENTTVRSRPAANTTGAKSTSLCWVRLIFLESAPNHFLHQPASLWFNLTIIQITKFGPSLT